MNARGTRQGSAFTLIEVVAIITAIGLLLVLLLVGVQHVKREALRKRCEDNLRTMGISIRGFGIDPWPESYMMALAHLTRTSPHLGDTRRYLLNPQMTNELKTPKTLICPADSVRTPAKSFPVLANTNISYFVGIDSGDTIPKSITAGDDNISVNGVIPLSGLM